MQPAEQLDPYFARPARVEARATEHELEEDAERRKLDLELESYFQAARRRQPTVPVRQVASLRGILVTASFL